MTFEWDAEKAASNLTKHGVSFDEAVTVFADIRALTTPDREHSRSELRYQTLGFSAQLRLLLVVTTERDENLRVISARKATSPERREYERYL
ncbi:MAG: BrnT family toxin [Betaproteobacteria bacterium]|nr:MAG: BrnT family toxin [Betaproteobacteria bacterium]